MVFFNTMTLQDRFFRQRWYLSVFGSVFLIFAVVAMAMAAVGVYAVMAQAAGRRTRRSECGWRSARARGRSEPGAGVGVKQLALGMVLGLAAALAVCRLMKGMFLVSPYDPLTFVAVAVTLGMTGLAAVYFPARRAARLDPVKALRYE